MIKGVIFDMDGTITLTEHLHFEAYSTVFKKYGIDDYTFEEEVRKYAGAGSPAIFSGVFKERGKPLSDEQLKELIAQKRRLYGASVHEAKIPVVPGVKEFIEKLESKGIRKAIATGNSDVSAVRFMLSRVGLESYFPEIVSVAEVAHGKPFPDVFLEAARRIGLTPEECIVCEDAVNGVKAARAAGMRCIGLETTSTREDLLAAGAAIVVKSYQEIPHDFI